MASSDLTRRITGVIFDFHGTLVNGGDPVGWLADAWRSLDRPGDPVDALGAETAQGAADFLDRIWEHAHLIDPESSRDKSPARHREVFDATIERAPGVDAELADALYLTMPDQWVAYDDAAHVLKTLRAQGIRVGVLSNVGFDLRPVLDRSPLAGAGRRRRSCPYEVGIVKPERRGSSEHTLALIERPAPQDALMVGDSWRDDSGRRGSSASAP